jgi:hypothetical protein
MPTMGLSLVATVVSIPASTAKIVQFIRPTSCHGCKTVTETNTSNNNNKKDGYGLLGLRQRYWAEFFRQPVIVATIRLCTTEKLSIDSRLQLPQHQEPWHRPWGATAISSWLQNQTSDHRNCKHHAGLTRRARFGFEFI